MQPGPEKGRAVALIQTRQTVPWTVMGRAGMKGRAVLGGKAGGS